MDSNIEVNLGLNEIELELHGGARGLKGDKGDKGDVGPANSLTIGTVQSGVEAEASITGNPPNQTLNLTLPKGDKGDTGPQGPPGTTDHTQLLNRNAPDQHTIGSITGLTDALNNAGHQIYKGENEPTDPKILVWIDTSTPIYVGDVFITKNNENFITKDNYQFTVSE